MADRQATSPPSPANLSDAPDLLDPQLAEEIFCRFTHRLVALARSRLDQRLTAKVDAEDVVQSVYKSFFWRCQDGQFDLASWNSLWGLLVRITVRKCLKQQDLYLAGRRHVGREVPPPAETSGTGGAWDGYAREPDPAQAAALVETVEQLMDGLDPQQQEMFSLRLQGYTVPEISQQTARSERTVERLLERIRHRIQRLEAPEHP
jgi:RNA polymerase sigma-70 factor (ECF subfamily)